MKRLNIEIEDFNYDDLKREADYVGIPMKKYIDLVLSSFFTSAELKPEDLRNQFRRSAERLP